MAGVFVISNILAEDQSQNQEVLLHSGSRVQRHFIYQTNDQTQSSLRSFLSNFFHVGRPSLQTIGSFCQNSSQNIKPSLKTRSPSQSYVKNDDKSRKIKTGKKIHHTVLRQLSHPTRVCVCNEGQTILNVVKPESASSLHVSH